jgi:PAS domain S-box-containing protein
MIESERLDKNQHGKSTRLEARLYAALDALREGVVIALQDGDIIYCNSAACGMYGIANPEQAGPLPFGSCHGYELWTVDGSRMLPLEEWPIARTARGESVRDVELVLRCSDQGWERIISYSGALLETGAGETLVYLAMHDLTEQRITAKSLHQSEERFRVVQELSPDGYTILRPVRDRNGKVTDFLWVYQNPAMARMNGTTPDSVVGHYLLEMFPQFKSSPFYGIYKKVAETGKAGVLEAPFVLGSTEPKWLRVAVVPSGDDIVILTQDVTERKQGEKAILESRAKLKAALASMSDAVFIADADGKLIDFNDSFVDFHRFSDSSKLPAAVSGFHQLVTMYLDDGREAPHEQWPVARALRGEKKSGVQYRLRRQDTGESWVGSYSYAPIRNHDGAVLGAVVTARDITAQKQAEEMLRLSEEKFAKAFAHNSAAIVLSRLEDGRYIEVNETWLAMVGYQREEIIGKTPHELEIWPAPDRGRIIEILQRQRSVHNLEFALRKRSGESTFVLASADVLTLAGDEVIVWSIVDITDRKQAEAALKDREEQLRKAKDELEIRVAERTRELEQTHRALQKEIIDRLTALESLRRNEQLLIQQSRLAAMGEMLANISHHWRQPLNHLGLLLQDLPVTCEMGEMDHEYLLGAVQKGMDIIFHLSRTIDTFGSLLRDDTEAEKQPFSANDAVATTIMLFEGTLAALNVDLRVEQTEDVVIDGSRKEFCQVIFNLVTNARDAFVSRVVQRPCLVIEVGKRDGRGIITITDNAGGIPEAIMDKIFDPFFSTKGPRGTGIGLFMCKNIIEKSMNGSLTVRNTGDGAQFTIVI